MVLDYLRETATANDYFAAADNGAGYLNPGMLQEPRPISGLPSGLDVWAAHCSKYYHRWGLTITGFIIDGYAPGLNQQGLDAYARFSPHGIVPQKIPLLLLHQQMPVIRAGWDVNQGDPAEAASVIVAQIKSRPVPFHWFRNILKSPRWYVRLQHGEMQIPRSSFSMRPRSSSWLASIWRITRKQPGENGDTGDLPGHGRFSFGLELTG